MSAEHGSGMDREQARILGLKALGWLVSQEELLPVFLGATGCSLHELKARAEDDEFLGAVLDFLLMDDAWILQLGADLALPPELPARARMALPGGIQRAWT